MSTRARQHSAAWYRLQLAAIVAALYLAFTLVPRHAIAAPPPPLASPAYYMRSVDPTTAYNLGVSLGQQDAALAGTQDRLVILDFGQAWTVTFAGITSYGTNIFTSPPTFVNVSSVETAAEQFGRGYYFGTGSHTTSMVKIVVGMNNYGVGPGGNQVSYGHGQVWEVSTNNVDAWLISNGYSSQARADAGGDLEVAWNSAGVTRSWVDGFASNSGATGRVMYDFGDAAGCPPYGSCDNGWTQADVWYISWGAPPAYALPEIYYSANASQWQSVSLYGYTNHGGKITFTGALAQFANCGCTNTAAAAWSQLYDALATNSATSQGSIRWSADIRYQ